MSQTVLIVDDERDAREVVRYALADAGYKAEGVDSADKALARLKRGEKPDLIVIDIVMPGLGGDRLCRLLKEDPETSSIPLLALTSSKREADLLDLGFDDYVVKPARIDRLKARVAALLRRGNRELARRLAVGQIELDSDAHGAWVKGRPIKPTPTEFKLLELLMRNKGRVLTYSTISQNLWSLEETVFKHSMETHLNNLRSKLGGAARQIETVKGVGYKLVP